MSVEKKGRGKKSGGGRASGGASRGKEEGREHRRRKELIDELQGLVQDIDEEGLLFLINQAGVLLYNQRVTRANQRLRERKAENGKPGPEKPGDGVRVVEREGGHFFIMIGGYHIYFDREEMRSMVRLCHAAGDEADASRRLYRWLSDNRRDLLIDGQVSGSADPRLARLYRHLVSTYRIKE